MNTMDRKRIEGYRAGQAHAQSAYFKNDLHIRETYRQLRAEFEASWQTARDITDGQVLKRIKKVKADSGADYPANNITAAGEGWNLWVWTFWEEFYRRTGTIPKHVSQRIADWSEQIPGTIGMRFEDGTTLIAGNELGIPTGKKKKGCDGCPQLTTVERLKIHDEQMLLINKREIAWNKRQAAVSERIDAHNKHITSFGDRKPSPEEIAAIKAEAKAIAAENKALTKAEKNIDRQLRIYRKEGDSIMSSPMSANVDLRDLMEIKSTQAVAGIKRTFIRRDCTALTEEEWSAKKCTAWRSVRSSEVVS
jgi:hypothetical protein